ncbi:ATP-dependent zinc metalloprotease FtsH [Algisphaera agarilytica]|uniref:ATP-dependent zinc metalloprotease FtsH n=1 Tax=Algisphaera agarilytica TaxID=1385975 RepID=A0A7X0LJ08_9BACT|nr:ATP-dependent zinc metalloprotease FtsH [Algisphaera agarilytica]MBB6428805.1 cell division protease FtsH [Algisphaera agarilytica]
MSDEKDPKINRGDDKRPARDNGNRSGKDDKPTGRGGGPGNNGKPNNVMSRGAFAWIMVGIIALVMLLLVNSAQNSASEVSWKEFYERAQNGDFDTNESLVVKNDRIIGQLREGLTGEIVTKAPNGRIFTPISIETKTYRLFLLDKIGYGNVKEDAGSNLLVQILIAWGPILLILFLIYFFVFRSIRGAGGGPGGMLGSFGRSKHKVLNKEHSNITLADVAGIDEAKDEVGEIIEFLKNPKKFQRLGGRVPRGVLLIGRPGCGKTLLAKAVAGEADAPFFSISGSDFVEMFVGVGASRVRDLFKQAKDSSPCIIFLDEIDAVGRRRGSGFSSGGHDEREQTLNAILVEMDGFDSSDQVIVMASTNRADVLDPALTRPGRFDRQVQVQLPDIKGRLEILKVHARKIKLNPQADLEKLARGTPMFSGAELAAIINEAAIGATLQNKDFVEQEDLEEARDKVRYGRSRKSHKIEEEEKKVIAYHEAGHAVVMYYDEHSEPLHKVTIIPRGQALGATFMLPDKDRHIQSKQQLLSMMRVSYGGRIAEQMFTGDQYNGTAGDIRQVMGVARAMVTEYGMSEKLGFQMLGVDSQAQPWEQPDKLYSDETAELIDAEIKRLIDTTYQETVDLITEHKQQTEDLAQALLKYETLTYEEVDKIMKGEPLNKATVSDLLAAEKEKLEAEQAAQADEPSTDRAADGDDDPAPGIMPTPA